jgi:hypothetical protein
MSRERRRLQFQRRVLAVVAKAEAEGNIRPGEYYEVPVRHDGWCDLLKGKGPCDCNPVVGEPERVPSLQEN